MAGLLTNDGNPSWATNPCESIARSSLSFIAKFWWDMVRLRLMLTGGDANLDSHQAMLIANLISRLKIDFGQIIFDEIFVRAHKVASALPFPCLITELCK